MSALSEKIAVLAPKQAYAGRYPTLNLAKGGQFGYAPRPSEWLNNQAYVRRPARAVLLSPPRLFESLKDAPYWIQALKALIEVHPKAITGFDFGLTLNTAAHPLGAGGQVQLEPVKTVRAESAPVFNYQLKVGRPEQRLVEAWIGMILDPNTTYSSALFRSDIVGASRTDINSGRFFADQYAATVLVFEPNQSFTHVEKAAIVHNFYPLTTGSIIMESNPTQDMVLEELNIPFSGIVDPCEGSVELAQTLLDAMRVNVLGANPCTQGPSYPSRDKILAESDDMVGYYAQVNDVRKRQLG